LVCLHFYKLSLDYMFLCHYSYLLSYFLFISLLCCWRFRLVFINFLFQTFVYCCWRTLGLVIDFWFWKPTEAHVFNQQKLEKDWFPKNQHKDEIPKKGKIVNEWKERKKRPSNELTVWSRNQRMKENDREERCMLAKTLFHCFQFTDERKESWKERKREETKRQRRRLAADFYSKMAFDGLSFL